MVGPSGRDRSGDHGGALLSQALGLPLWLVSTPWSRFLLQMKLYFYQWPLLASCSSKPRLHPSHDPFVPSRLEPHGRLLQVTPLGCQHGSGTALAASGPQLLCADSENTRRRLHFNDAVCFLLTSQWISQLQSSSICCPSKAKGSLN